MLPFPRSTPQQGMPSNQGQSSNSSNFLPNSGQIPPQMGIMNPRIATPFNNSLNHLCNGNVMTPNAPISTPSPCFMNTPNPVLPLHNGVSPFGPQNLNFISNQMNPTQLPGQFFSHNTMNPTQFFNQNSGLLNSQFCFQRSVQNMNQFVQMQLPNFGQVLHGNIPLGPNQVPPVMGPQTNSFNPQFGMVHSNGAVQHGNQGQHNVIPLSLDANASNRLSNSTPRLQGSSCLPPDFGSFQQQQTQNTLVPLISSKSQLQESAGKDSRFNKSNANWKNYQNKNFPRRPKHTAHNVGKPQLPNFQNAKGRSRLHNERGRQGFNIDGARKSDLGISTNQHQEKKRILPLNYTEQEIQQWREERRKNYPTKTNIHKKTTANLTQPEAIDNDTKLRCLQLKEILAKQAELGCEVAEIPTHYLLDSDQPANERVENTRPFSKKEKFQNRFNKRGKFGRNDRSAKRQRSELSSRTPDVDTKLSKNQRFVNHDPSGRQTMDKREPTLLQKLLDSDIKREKSQLMQVFRFMVTNSFFKDWPDKPLMFPPVIVKETGLQDAVIPSHVQAGVENSNIEESNSRSDARHKGETDALFRQDRSEPVELEEEEGEIID